MNDSYDDTGALENLESENNIALDLYGHNVSFLATSKTLGISITFTELKRRNDIYGRINPKFWKLKKHKQHITKTNK